MITELHCHTTASDGGHTPTDVVQMAKLRKVAVLAVTDHDTIAAHAEATACGERMGVRVIPGIEISALSPQGKEVHVLGYGVVPTDNDVRQRIAVLRDVREARARGMVAKLEALGIHVSYDRIKALAGDAMIGRPHVAKVLLEAGYVSGIQEAFDKYLAEGKPAFVPHEGLTPAEAVALIHRAHGAAVLAHPALFQGDLDALLAEVLAAGLDGIEAFYPMHTPAQTAHYVEIARRHDLILTGGSDFHSLQRDSESAIGSISLPENASAALDQRIQRYA